MTLKVAVMASGGGTDFQSLIDAQAKGELAGAELVVLITNNPDAYALERATKAGIPSVVIPHLGKSREAFDAEVMEKLEWFGLSPGTKGEGLVVLAGFMRLLSAGFVTAYNHRLINIHPALLPSFPGTHAHRDVLAYGCKVSGCTVHFVDEGTDSGPVILQRTVPVLEGDDEASLGARVLVEEHKALPEAVRLFATGRLTLEGRIVHVTPPA